MITENQIERIYEKSMDALDEGLLSGVYTQEQYEQEVQDLNKWMAVWESLFRESKIDRSHYEWPATRVE